MVSRFTGYGNRAPITPQSEPIPGSNQIPNNAGGWAFQVDDMTRLRRFLVLSTAGGSYYIGERKLTKQNLDCLERLLKEGRGKEVVDLIVAISDAGRGVSNDPALFALARCCAADDMVARQRAYAALPKVARTGTHLLHFVEFVKQFRGRGRAHRRALKAWYNDKRAGSLAYQLLKYQNRDGWSQRDVLRLTRPKPGDTDHNALYRWAVKGWDGVPEAIPSEASDPSGLSAASRDQAALPLGIQSEALGLIWAFEKAKHTTEANQVADLVLTYKLPREAVPTEHLKSVAVWEALLADMPMEALIRNIGVMTANGTLAPFSKSLTSVISRLRDGEALKKARIHPIKVLAALTTYAQGHSEKGKLSWTPLQPVLDALNDAFYASFGNVTPTGKRILIAIDTSGSMSSFSAKVNGIPGLSVHQAAGAMALVTANSEPVYHIIGVDTDVRDLPLSPKQRLDDVVRALDQYRGGGTNLALPMAYAMQRKLVVDAFILYTDGETWAGYGHPAQLLRTYRQLHNPQARFINVAMTATHVTAGDTSDPLVLEVCGFDTTAPQVISEFVMGL